MEGGQPFSWFAGPFSCRQNHHLFLEYQPYGDKQIRWILYFFKINFVGREGRKFGDEGNRSKKEPFRMLWSCDKIETERGIRNGKPRLQKTNSFSTPGLQMILADAPLQLRALSLSFSDRGWASFLAGYGSFEGDGFFRGNLHGRWTAT